MPSTSSALSDVDPTAARNGFFDALYAKYPSEKEKFADAKGKLDAGKYSADTGTLGRAIVCSALGGQSMEF